MGEKMEFRFEQRADDYIPVKTSTGYICQESGDYHCSEHEYQFITMVKGKRFPPCMGRRSGHGTRWERDVLINT